MSRSSWSRDKKPPYEVGEISDEDAVDYLKKRGINQDLAKKVVKNITGGLFVMLNDYVSKLQKGMTYEAILQILNKNTYQVMLDLKISVKMCYFSA
jgi:hypothetical protein